MNDFIFTHGGITMDLDFVIYQLVDRAAKPIQSKREQLKNKISDLLFSIRERERTDDNYYLHLDIASVYYVNQFLGQITVIGDWVSKGYYPDIDSGMKQLEKIFDLCRELSYQRKYLADNIDPLKEIREKQPMSASIRSFEDFYNFCYIRNEIVMSLFDVLIYEKDISHKLFGLIKDQSSIVELKQTFIFYIEGYANQINHNL